jgi:predicted HTH domain antitoxin
MTTTKTERVEIELPRDIIFAMRGLQKPEEVKKKLKIALAIFLFQERAISLGKATELTKMSRVRFIEVLKEHGIPAYEYKKAAVYIIACIFWFFSKSGNLIFINIKFSKS